MYPAYLNLFYNGKLQEISEKLFSLLQSCSICPRKCKVNRKLNQPGFCQTGLLPKVYSFMSHPGEEPPLSGTNGSGTIFFAGCNMACHYCQNYKFSQLIEQTKEVSLEELADIMLKLQYMGCHNINLVTPTHVLPQILKALIIAIPQGLNLPLAYNTGGYELAQIIKLLSGIIDIYLPDMRYADNAWAIKYSNALDYPQYNQESIKEMHKQVGVAQFDEKGIITKGVIIRHLVLPNDISGTKSIMSFIAERISPETYISLMSQYTPYFKACGIKEISRRITQEEYLRAQKILQKYNLHNGWTQESGGLESLAGVHIKPMQY